MALFYSSAFPEGEHHSKKTASNLDGKEMKSVLFPLTFPQKKLVSSYR